MIKKIFRCKKDKVNVKKIKIIYMNQLLKMEINNWLKYMNILSFDEILMNIGFRDDDYIYLSGISLEKIYYSYNKECFDEDNVISLSCGKFLESRPEIKVTTKNMSKTYGFNYDNNIQLESYEYLLDNGILCKRCYIDNGLLYLVSNKQYVLLLNVLNDDRKEYKFSIDNELELEKYFGSLVFPISIDDVYSRVCDIISLDIDKCRMFELRVNEISLDNHKYLRDIISLSAGNVVRFGMTKNGKRIFLEEDGSCSYELVRETEEELKFNFSMDIKKDNFSYSVSSSEGNVLDEEIKMMVNNNVLNAVSSIEDCKKKVRKMFFGRWNN